MYIVRCPQAPQRWLRNAEWPFFVCKIALHLQKVCYNVSLCEYCRRQSCKAFTGLSIRAEMIGGGRSLKGKFSY